MRPFDLEPNPSSAVRRAYEFPPDFPLALSKALTAWLKYPSVPTDIEEVGDRAWIWSCAHRYEFVEDIGAMPVTTWTHGPLGELLNSRGERKYRFVLVPTDPEFEKNFLVLTWDFNKNSITNEVLGKRDHSPRRATDERP